MELVSTITRTRGSVRAKHQSGIKRESSLHQCTKPAKTAKWTFIVDNPTPSVLAKQYVKKGKWFIKGSVITFGSSGPLNVESELEQEFNELAEQWHRETGMLSFARQKAIHPAYQKIIGMGTNALPFILRTLQRKGGDWLWALEAISRKENPAAGITNFKEAVAAWIRWGTERGYIG